MRGLVVSKNYLENKKVMNDNRSKEYMEKSKVDPKEKWERDYWTDKWGITDQELMEAIEQTGGNNVREIEKYLINKKTSDEG